MRIAEKCIISLFPKERISLEVKGALTHHF